ncbi:hypothetical protein LXD69_01805 [Flavobacterium sediminilitoris]|uniref:Uncharacterized protein n=1 Tax=Flavobacterium sediminilitoris TaxID=2024526 RepID=A0ABY4HPN9_9FLAO|nr:MULTISPECIES: hypothetical protein [Flavobacterium]UOX34262.1 hypothetical protein LXD69_01805 [Flavobacterium sediminilitoris]
MKRLQFLQAFLKDFKNPFSKKQKATLITVGEKQYCESHFMVDYYCNDQFLFI